MCFQSNIYLTWLIWTAEASDKLLNIFLHRGATVDFVPHHSHCKCIMKGSSDGQYEQEERLQQEKNSFNIHLGSWLLF